jgi:Domain of unknown function (DUF1877)
MPTICRLIQLTPAEGDALLAKPDSLKDCVAAAKAHSDVYRYWHGIQFLLDRHRPDTPAAQWLDLGRPIRSGDPSLPDDRLINPTDVAALNAVLKDVAPDDLAAHYDASAMDAANVYPGTWQVWEEDFDPLGQVLEHYFFLQQFASQCAGAKTALLLHFDFLAEGSV